MFSRRQVTQRGLTLVEVLVSILILGTAVATLLALLTQHTRNADIMRENVLGRIAAENVMVMTVLDEQSGTRDDQGTIDLAGRSFVWEVFRAPAPLEGLEIVTVEIRAPENSDHLLATISTLSPEQQP